LDHIEDILRRGFPQNVAKFSAIKLLEDYSNKCSLHINKDLCRYYVEEFSEVKERLNKNLDLIINPIDKKVKSKIGSVELLFNMSTEILSTLLRLKLFLEGFRGRRDFSISREAYIKTFHQAKSIETKNNRECFMENKDLSIEKLAEHASYLFNASIDPSKRDEIYDKIGVRVVGADSRMYLFGAVGGVRFHWA